MWVRHSHPTPTHPSKPQRDGDFPTRRPSSCLEQVVTWPPTLQDDLEFYFDRIAYHNFPQITIPCLIYPPWTVCSSRARTIQIVCLHSQVETHAQHRKCPVNVLGRKVDSRSQELESLDYFGYAMTVAHIYAALCKCQPCFLGTLKSDTTPSGSYFFITLSVNENLGQRGLK